MLRSMYSGISGMKTNQVKLDVIGNNISNVGTTAFKSSRARFQDMLSQNVKDAMAPNANVGGMNPSQVGLGVQLASIDTVMSQGMMQPTGRTLDLAVDGEGFFMVSKGPQIAGDATLEVNHRQGNHSITAQSLANSGNEIMFSRDGSFTLDEGGNLITSDGYRVLGYSLTNDDTAERATEKNPNTVSTAGLDFRFGPGSALNGYKVVLGSIGPNTPTTCDVDKVSKEVILNGDFATAGAIKTPEVESAINKGLSAAGIAQSIFVTGKPVTIQGLGSANLVGGQDDEAPNSVSVGGFTFQFSEGSALNGYSFEFGKTAPPADKDSLDINVAVNKGAKKVIIDADLVNKGAFNGEDLVNAINGKFQAEGIDMQIINYSGSPINISDLSTKVGKGSMYKAPNMVQSTNNGLTFTAKGLDKDTGSELNGYSIVANEDTSLPDGTCKVDIASNQINVAIGKATTADKIEKAINDKLKEKGIRKCTIGVAGAYKADAAAKPAVVGNDGSDFKSANPVKLMGFNIQLPKGDLFDNCEIQIGDINAGNITAKAKLDGGKITKIVISGPFSTLGKIKSDQLAEAIKDGVNAVSAGAIDNKDDNKKVTVKGSQSNVLSGLTSNTIDGGSSKKAPQTISVNGMNFSISDGAALNGYSIDIGRVTAGTKTSVEIDEKSKKIILNGDFATGTNLEVGRIQNELNKALSEKGINQTIEVAGTPNVIGGLESGITNGGTPVQSLGSDGEVNFVDGTKDLKSYDGGLKTLKIPEKIKVPGTGLELRVKTYSIDKNGVINAVLEDGRVAALGQIAMSSFKNPTGLTKLGKNLYSQSVNSGEATIKSGVGTRGDDNSKGYGAMLQGMLEMSNVDLAEQFTDMIVTNRAFQASGKMITTGDEILQDIINLKR